MRLNQKTILFQVFIFFFSLICYQLNVYAADLLQVYQQALVSDPTFQQAIAQRLSTRQGVPISIAALLPNISAEFIPSITKSTFSGNKLISTVGPSGNLLLANSNTSRAYSLTLTATQTVFNYAQFAVVAEQLALAKGADAILNAALQSLMIRVSSAYFAVLRDEDTLAYSAATKRAFREQLDQIKQQYQVGLKTTTDLYTAQASYDSAVANYIAAQTTLIDDRENLRVITGCYYPKLTTLSQQFPLIRPKPADIEAWVSLALQQNWSIKASEYNVETARQKIKQEFAGHFPIINLEGTVDKLYANNSSSSVGNAGNGLPSSSFSSINGPGTQIDRSIAVSLTMPIFSGGGVAAQTHQAMYNLEVAQQQLEQTIRNTLNTTRQSYLGILAGISQINADKLAIKSTISSLKGLQASYHVGTETLVDVLNQQQKVLQAQTQYAADRYTFVNNILLLKQAAGTLSFDDLRAINTWLIDRR